MTADSWWRTGNAGAAIGFLDARTRDHNAKWLLSRPTPSVPHSQLPSISSMRKSSYSGRLHVTTLQLFRALFPHGLAAAPTSAVRLPTDS